MRCHRVSCRFTGPLHGEPVTWVHVLAGVPLLVPRPWRPAADVWETDEAWTVRLDVPGVAEERLRAVVHTDALVVEGVRAAAPPPGARCHAAELRSGPFRFAIRLPAETDPETAEARLDRGVLEVRLPKRGPRRIEVTP